MERLCFTEDLLQNNLLIIHQSVETTEVLQVHAIMHISIGIPVIWLTPRHMN